jgi:hypothetical protein
LPAQMPVGQLKIWPINIKWHLQLLTNIETHSRPRFTNPAFVWNSCLGMSVKLIPTAARPTGCRNSRQSQRDDGPLFRLFHNQTDTRFFVKHFSSVFLFFGAGERERMQVWTIVEHSINKRMKREGKWVTSL